MLAIRSCMSIVSMLIMLSVSFQLCSADNLSVRNMLTNTTARVTVACHSPYADWWSIHSIVSGGNSREIHVPYTGPSYFYWVPPYFSKKYYCDALWNGVHLKVYRSDKDHMTCKDECKIQLRDNGAYRWNLVTGAWDVIDTVRAVSHK